MSKITLSEGLVELINLERQYPDWDKTPEAVKDKMVRLALAHGGFEVFRHEKNYLNYILKLSEDLYISYSDEREKDIDKLTKKLTWLAKLLYEHYSPSMVSKRATDSKKAKIYLEVEKYRSRNAESSINQAVKEVAKKLRLDYLYTYRRYYEIRKKLKGIPLEKIIEDFKLRE